MSDRYHNDWTAEREQALRDLWADTALSAAAIGRQLGLSKNAIVGKARRLDLPNRPSPIITTGPRTQASKAQARRRARVQQPPTPKPPRAAVISTQVLAGERSAQARREADRRQHRPVYVGNSAPLHYPPELTCQWIEGDLRHGGSYCGGARAPDRPYCAAHCEVAYVHIRQAVAA